jgi:hypothetical protein
MAAKPLPDQAKAIAGKLLAAVPFLKPKAPGLSRAAEPFDTIEDDGPALTDDFGPNVAVDLRPAKADRAAGGTERIVEAAKGLGESILRSKLALGIILAILVLVLALCVAAAIVGAPPKEALPPAKASPEGAALLDRLILPAGPGIEARVELEREPDRVYTADDAAAFFTDPATVDITGLEARNRAEIDSLYRAVP